MKNFEVSLPSCQCICLYPGHLCDRFCGRCRTFACCGDSSASDGYLYPRFCGLSYRLYVSFCRLSSIGILRIWPFLLRFYFFSPCDLLWVRAMSLLLFLDDDSDDFNLSFSTWAFISKKVKNEKNLKNWKFSSMRSIKGFRERNGCSGAPLNPAKNRQIFDNLLLRSIEGRELFLFIRATL